MAGLEALAARCGIEAEFRDAHGTLRHTAPATQRALLTAMGIAADDEAQVSASLEALDHAEWGRILPPVCVAYAGTGPVAVDLILPVGTGAIDWRIVLEAGDEMHGQAGFGALAFTGRRDLDGERAERRRFVIPDGVPCGYHRLIVRPGEAEMALIVTPGSCWVPPAVVEGRRLWGVSAQLYLLRSAGDWGIGDYSDLRRLTEILSARGADIVGLNPLHELFLDNPEHASPYSPASRLLLNVLNIDVSTLPELAACPRARDLIASTDFQSRLAICRGASLVDYAGIAALKLPILRMLFDDGLSAPDRPRWRAFEAFRREGGEVLARNCLFQALRHHFAHLGQADWHSWPEEYRDPSSPAVARFAEDHRELVSFRIWLQFLADTQLAEAAAVGKGMAVGLYRDLAVGADRAGAETWANQMSVVADAQIGAPPDIHNPAGQDWGLPPFHPRALREEAYRSFIELIRANMRHAGGLRIDHVMALQHLYWVPRGGSPADGAYVRYPLEDLVGILALESQRQQCLVVGEDLGTVPQGFRERMAAANILSYRVLLFEKDEDGFLPPDRYPTLAVAVAGSHDLPTLRGWWESRDLDIKDRLHLFPDPASAKHARQERARDRTELVEAFRREGLLQPGKEMDVQSLIRIAHAFLARSDAVLAVAQLDDITDEAEQVNVPATSEQHPNWRRRLSLTLEQLDRHPRLKMIADIFAAERARGA